MRTLINFELLKFFKNKIVFFVLVFIVSFLLNGVIYLIAPSYSKPSGFLMLSSLLTLISPLLCFIVIILGVMFFSQEYEGGTLRMILIGKFSRVEILIAKIISLLISVSILVFIIFLSSIFAGLLFSHFEGIKIQGYVLKTSLSLWLDTFRFFLVLILFLYSYTLLGFLLGLVFKRFLFSIIGSFFIYFLLITFSILPKIKNFLFSYYFDLMIDSFGKLTKGIYVSIPFFVSLLVNLFYVFIFVFSGIYLFKRVEI